MPASISDSSIASFTATSSTPVIVTVTSCVVPSAVTAVKLSVSVSPFASAWIADWVLSAA